MTHLLEKAYDPESFREKAHQLVEILADHYHASLKQEYQQVIPWMEPHDRYDIWKDNMSRVFENDEYFREIVKETIRIHHPRYMGHQVSPSFPMSGLCDMINGSLNNGSAVYEMGPVSTVMERIVIEWLCGIMGYDSGSSGFLTSGGSIGNFTALLAARQVQSGYNYWKEGVRNGYRPAIMVSEEAHYSVARAVQMMGWGENGIVKVPVNEKLQLDYKELEGSRLKAQGAGLQVIGLVGNACSTSTGSYDPLEPMADFCEKYRVWFHVDGAHGGSAALSPKYKHLTKGIERADSIVIDFHKMMGMSALTTAVLFKRADDSYATFDQNAGYLLNEADQDPWYDGAHRTVECTKNMMGIKVYTLLKTYGPQVFIDYLNTCYDLGNKFAAIINHTRDFELAVEPMSNIVCFRMSPASHNFSQSDLNSLNSRIRKQLLESGKFYIVQTWIGDRLFLRASLMNPFTSEQDIRELLDEIRILSHKKQ